MTEEFETRGETHRTCSKCGERKPLSHEFFVHTTTRAPSGRRYLTGRCRICDASAARLRWASNPAAALMDKSSRDGRRDEIRAYDRERAVRDLEKKRPKIRAWMAANPDRVKRNGRASSQRRRAKVLLAEGTWTADEFDRVIEAQGRKCWWCAKSLGKRIHADHRIPLAKEGGNDISNIVASCPTCNHSKGAKMPWEFTGRLL